MSLGGSGQVGLSVRQRKVIDPCHCGLPLMLVTGGELI